MSSNPSIMLWLAASVVAVLGLRAFLEYLRRLEHQGPITGWRDLLLGATALQGCVWSTMIVGVSAQGLEYEIGFHPVKLFGSLLATSTMGAVVLLWVGLRANWFSIFASSLLLVGISMVQQFSVIWSLGTEPAVPWRFDLLVFSALLLVAGFLVMMFLVLGAKRGSRRDRWGYRMLAALVGAMALVLAQELTLLAVKLHDQSVSAYARYMPEVATTLLAGAAMPILFLVMIADHHMQRRIRRASRKGKGRDRRLDSPDTGAITTHGSGLPPPTR